MAGLLLPQFLLCVLSALCGEALSCGLHAYQYRHILRPMRNTHSAKTKEMQIEKGSGNVYADLGFPDSEDMLIKAQLDYPFCLTARRFSRLEVRPLLSYWAASDETTFRIYCCSRRSHPISVNSGSQNVATKWHSPRNHRKPLKWLFHFPRFALPLWGRLET